ncbi:MAG TPA: twin-arginine translocation signal domain-containing protein, partial [Caulobacteraceae bacterium]
MHRRDLLKGCAALPLAAALAPVAAIARTGVRRVRPTDPTWPSVARWDELKQRVGGRLLIPQPLAAACESAPDSPACFALPAALRNPYYVGDQPGG